MIKYQKTDYLLVSKEVLPDYYEKVIQAKELLRSGAVKEVSEAVKMAGVSRSTFYKYRDYVFAPSEGDSCRKAVLSLVMHHERGMLGRVLNLIGEFGANVLTITQNPPISNRATVVLTLDISGITANLNETLNSLSKLSGVEHLSLIDVS